MNNEPLHIMKKQIAYFVNNRKCAIDGFKCVHRVRKVLSAIVDMVQTFQLVVRCRISNSTDYNPQQSSYLVIN
jgi:hypothetical protein